jgi:SOS-response transcriptional repressor LexA
MSDDPTRSPDRDRATHDAWLDELAAGVHDDALVRLAAAAISSEEPSAWDDPGFVEWWIARARSAASRAARRLTDAEFVAAGRALRALALARSAGVQWRGDRPVLLPAGDDGTAPLVEMAVAAGVGRELWDEPVDAWIALEESLGPDAPTTGKHLALRIAGDSMEPLMHTGDTVLVALGRPLHAGAVVVARHPEDGYVCKRVKRLRASTVELESLAPGRPIIKLPRDESLVVGQVVAVWCHHCR